MQLETLLLYIAASAFLVWAVATWMLRTGRYKSKQGGNMTQIAKVELQLEIETKEPIIPEELTRELTEIVKKECPELGYFKIKVIRQPQPISPE